MSVDTIFFLSQNKLVLLFIWCSSAAMLGHSESIEQLALPGLVLAGIDRLSYSLLRKRSENRAGHGLIGLIEEQGESMITPHGTRYVCIVSST